MENLPHNLNEIEVYSVDKAIVEETAAQLKKDFNEFRLEIEFTGNHPSPYQELFAQVVPYIELLLRNNSEMLRALLYRIDVSEKAIKKANFETPGLPYPELLTDLILRRELQKVLTKRYFSKNK